MGTKDGSIIATIITAHIPRNDAAAPGHVCPGIRIHAIDIVQPPGIAIPPIADMDSHQTIVTAALAAKSSAETPRKTRCEARSVNIERPIPFRRRCRIGRRRCPIAFRRRSATNSAGSAATAADLRGPVPAKFARALRKAEYWR